MDAELTLLLTRNNIHDDVVAAMKAKSCLSIEDFANWVENRAELDACLIDSTSQKDSGNQKSRIKMAWRQAEAMTAKSLERISMGLATEVLDEPLDDTQSKSLEAAFTTYYHTRMFPPERIGRDILLGRIYREFQACKPNMYQISKVRTIGDMSSAPGTIKRRIGHNATLTVEGEDSMPDMDVGNVLVFIDRLEFLANTWALAGCHTVAYMGKDVVFAWWPDCQDYVWAFRKECSALMSKFTEGSIIDYATKVEDFALKLSISSVATTTSPGGQPS